MHRDFMCYVADFSGPKPRSLVPNVTSKKVVDEEIEKKAISFLSSGGKETLNLTWIKSRMNIQKWNCIRKLEKVSDSDNVEMFPR